MHSKYKSDYDYDFAWFLQTQLDVTCDKAHGDNQSLEFYASVTASLKYKTVYELMLLLQASDKFIHTTHTLNQKLASVKQAVYEIIQQKLEQSVITQEDIHLFSKLEDTQCLGYALKVLQPLRDKVTDERQRFMYNQLILTLHIRLQLLATMHNKRSTVRAKSTKASIATCKGRPSTDILYQEVVSEMTSTALPATPEYTVTLTTPLDINAIMQDYTEKESTLCMQPLTQVTAAFMQKLQISKETLVTHTKQKKALEETCVQLRNNINQDVQHYIDYLDTAPEKLLILEQERTRLLDEERELIIERELFNKRLDAVNTRIIQLNTLEKKLEKKFKQQH